MVNALRHNLHRLARPNHTLAAIFTHLLGIEALGCLLV